MPCALWLALPAANAGGDATGPRSYIGPDEVDGIRRSPE